MPEKKRIDFDVIANNCQLFDDLDSEIIIANLYALKNQYKYIEFISISFSSSLKNADLTALIFIAVKACIIKLNVF